MSLLVFQNGVYVYKTMPQKASSYILKNNSNNDFDFQELVLHKTCVCNLEVSDPVQYINSDCIDLSFDGNTMKVYPWMQTFFITVKDITSVSINGNSYGTLKISQL